MAIDVEEYYIKYGPMVFRRCMQLLKDVHKAEDAMQDVFVKLMKYQKTLKHQYPSSLLYRMATNVCLNIFRDENKHKAINNDDLLEMIATYEDDVEDKAGTRDLLNRLFKNEKESTRVIATLHFVDKLTLQQVASEVSMSVSGVRKRLRQLKDKVKQLSLEVR